MIFFQQKQHGNTVLLSPVAVCMAPAKIRGRAKKPRLRKISLNAEQFVSDHSVIKSVSSTNQALPGLGEFGE